MILFFDVVSILLLLGAHLWERVSCFKIILSSSCSLSIGLLEMAIRIDELTIIVKLVVSGVSYCHDVDLCLPIVLMKIVMMLKHLYGELLVLSYYWIYYLVVFILVDHCNLNWTMSELLFS